MPANNGYAFTYHGETVIALPERALWWPQRSTLFLADLHFGKLGHFQTYGVPLPDHEDDTDLRRLDELITRYEAKRVIVLGDLFHSDVNEAWPRLVAWRKTHKAIAIELVPGNHDRWLSIEAISAGGFTVLEPLSQLGPFVLTHEPLINPTTATLSGHLHPAITLRGRGRDVHRLPCFWITPNQIVLPAFGMFTGMHGIHPQPNDIVLAVAHDRIVRR